MPKSSAVKLSTLDDASTAFWSLQLQWNGRSNGTTYTVEQANKILQQLTTNLRLPDELRKQAYRLQQEIIRGRTRKSKAKATKTTKAKAKAK